MVQVSCQYHYVARRCIYIFILTVHFMVPKFANICSFVIPMMAVPNLTFFCVPYKLYI